MCVRTLMHFCVSLCSMHVCVYRVAVVHGGGDLSEDVSGLCLHQSPPLIDVVIQLPSAGVLHHYHYLITTLKHYTGRAQRKVTLCVYVCVFSFQCVCACVCILTLVEAYDVGVFEGGGDFYLSLDMNSVQIISDALLTNRLDGHLRTHNTRHTHSVRLHYGYTHLRATNTAHRQTHLRMLMAQAHTQTIQC